MITLEELNSDYDWKEAFAYASGVRRSGDSAKPVVFCGVSSEGFDTTDVAEIIVATPGERDGAFWQIVVKLKDGRYGFLSAGCDYTGWDCRAGGASAVSDSLETLLQYGLTQQEREWFEDNRPKGEV